MMKPVLAFIGFAALALPAFAADTYTFDPEYTLASFEVEHLGFTTQRGRFNKAQGQAVIDVAAHQGAVEFTIQTNSLDMGTKAWTIHVSSAGLFDVEHYPTITFKSDSLQFDGNKVIGADGQLMLLGISKPLHIVVNNFNCGTHPVNKKAMCAGNITATLKRSDYGMVKYIPTVSDEIRINVPVEAYRDK
jgi:polyisoprenoid-binding protein YceI